MTHAHGRTSTSTSTPRYHPRSSPGSHPLLLFSTLNTHTLFSSSIPLLFFLVVPYFRLFFFLFRESLYFLNVSTQPRVVGYYKRSFFLFFSFLQYLTHHHPFLHCSFFTSLPPNQTNLIASTPLNHPTERCSNSSLYPPPSFLFFLPFLLISLSLFHALSLC